MSTTGVDGGDGRWDEYDRLRYGYLRRNVPDERKKKEAKTNPEVRTERQDRRKNHGGPWGSERQVTFDIFLPQAGFPHDRNLDEPLF